MCVNGFPPDMGGGLLYHFVGGLFFGGKHTNDPRATLSGRGGTSGQVRLLRKWETIWRGTRTKGVGGGSKIFFGRPEPGAPWGVERGCGVSEWTCPDSHIGKNRNDKFDPHKTIFNGLNISLFFANGRMVGGVGSVGRAFGQPRWQGGQMACRPRQ